MIFIRFWSFGSIEVHGIRDVALFVVHFTLSTIYECLALPGNIYQGGRSNK